MTIEEARKLIPPGWVECGETAWANNAAPNWRMRVGVNVIYAIPAPKPEPRRVPAEEIGVTYDQGFFTAKGIMPISQAGRSTKWILDFDAREWVEVVE